MCLALVPCLSDSDMYDNLTVAADVLWGQEDKELIYAEETESHVSFLGSQGSCSSNSNNKEQLLLHDQDEDEDEEPPEYRCAKVKRRQVIKFIQAFFSRSPGPESS